MYVQAGKQVGQHTHLVQSRKVHHAHHSFPQPVSTTSSRHQTVTTPLPTQSPPPSIIPPALPLLPLPLHPWLRQVLPPDVTNRQPRQQSSDNEHLSHDDEVTCGDQSCVQVSIGGLVAGFDIRKSSLLTLLLSVIDSIRSTPYVTLLISGQTDRQTDETARTDNMNRIYNKQKLIRPSFSSPPPHKHTHFIASYQSYLFSYPVLC